MHEVLYIIACETYVSLGVCYVNNRDRPIFRYRIEFAKETYIDPSLVINMSIFVNC